MGRKSVYTVGQFFGKLEIVEILPSSGAGTAVKLRCICHYCNSETIKSGDKIKKRNSCGCQQNNSSTWKRVGPKTKPWQLASGQSARNNLKYQYQRGAEKRNLKFDLTDEEFDAIVAGDCAYCGDKTPAKIKGQGKTSGDFNYTGIDRIDSSEGYVKYNCVSCCWSCNNMKGKLELEKFMEQIEKIYNHNHEQNNKGN
jgi:hypothetical protein